MKINNRTFFLFITIVIIISGQCKNDDSPTKPPATILPDTTSHDFTWQIEILGDGNSSRLNDVCIIDENDVWAVGKIYLKDSTGEFIYPPYNAVHWNGTQWEFKKITVIYKGNAVVAPLYGVFAFSSTDIWTTSGVPIHGNGEKWKIYHLFDMGILEQTDGSILKMWGESSDDIYFVGLKGSIVHYNGTTWQKLESGTNLDIQNIWGGIDPITGEEIVLAVAGKIFETHDRTILKIDETHAEKISDAGIYHTLKGIWFDPRRIYYVVGDGIYSTNSLEQIETWNGPGLLTVTQYFSHAVRGNHINDVFVAGAFGDVLHFNGNSWRSYREYTALQTGGYHALAVKGDCVFAAGTTGDRAVVLRGIRN